MEIIMQLNQISEQLEICVFSYIGGKRMSLSKGIFIELQ